MAKDTNQVGTRRFDKELSEDVNDFHLPDNSWTQARNAINNSKTGDLGKLGNEPSTINCINITYTGCGTSIPKIIGTIHIIADTWAIFSTNGTCSEIGIFKESVCSYETVVNDPCLNFSANYLIKGVSRPAVTCTYNLYWDDGFNPSRTMAVIIDPVADNAYTSDKTPIPWQQICKDENGKVISNLTNIIPKGCIDCQNQPALNCDKIRLATFIEAPCVEVQNGFGSGTLLNGSYMAAVAYSIDGIKISDWYISNIQPLFNHNNAACSLDVLFDNMDQNFEEVQVAIIYVVNQQTVAKLAGTYSTRQQRLSFDTISDSWETVPIEQIPISTPIVDKTDAMYNTGGYLIRTGIESKFNFNYQPLANQIVTKWQSVAYPDDYYRKGGNKTNYLRDEVYSFFIRFIYDTGDKSSSYHIPGRSPYSTDTNTATQDVLTDEIGNTPINQIWNVYNTAIVIPPAPNKVLPDGGVVISEGYMGYWESSEKYPDNKPEVWNSYSNPLGLVNNVPHTGPFNTNINPYNISGYQALVTDLDLCGKQIRHHKFPDLFIYDPIAGTNNKHSTLEYYDNVQRKIHILGVAFDNIKPPVYNDGTAITSIVGYEILRGTRNGNKTILAKGLIKNLRQSAPIKGTTNKTSLFINYPYNDLGPDPFLSTGFIKPPQGVTTGMDSITPVAPLTRYKNNVLSFHSPDTNFTEPFLSPKEIKLHGEFRGNITGKFEYSEKHPKEKLLTNISFVISAIAGVAIAMVAQSGKRTVNYTSPKTPGYSEENVPAKTDKEDQYGNLSYDPGVVIYTNGAPYFPPITTNEATGYYYGDVTGYNEVKPNGSGQYPMIQTSPTYTDIKYIKGTSNATSAAGIILGYFSNGLTGYNDNRAGTLLVDSLLGRSELSGQIVNGLADNSITEAKDHPALSTGGIDVQKEDGAYDNIPSYLKSTVLNSSIPLYMSYFVQGTDTVLNFFKAMASYTDYALRYHSHCFYDTYETPTIGNQRRDISNIAYVEPNITLFGSSYRINNLYRSKAVVLETLAGSKSNPITAFTIPKYTDVSRILASYVNELTDTVAGISVLKDPTKATFDNTNTYTLDSQYILPGYPYGFSGNNALNFDGTVARPQTASSHYASLKQRLINQYGQINGVVEVPVSTCSTNAYIITIDRNGKPQYAWNKTTGTLFGGDTYLGRYTEKNTFFFFYNWLYGEPDGAQFDYTKNIMVGYPNFWANFNQFETGDFMSSIGTAITTLSPISGILLPSDFHSLDKLPNQNWVSSLVVSLRWTVQYSYFYLFNSGVLDFYTESEYNLDLRDWGELETERHYDPWRYDDTKALFDTNIIKATNYYKYDDSLSVSKLWVNYTPWAVLQRRNYDPILAEECYVYNPTKVIYSLPNQYESLKDNWKIFLPNSYKDFESVVTCIKPINKSGAMILFESQSPVMFQGTDTLETGLGTKLVIGDGGLFSQPMQSITNADAPYEYASCQDRLSVINTPMGIYWISQNQGKIFSYTNSLNELSMNDIKWWLVLYLPFKLVQQFPNFALTNNPVIGVGTQSIYDNQNGLLYFTKKDYSLRTDLPASITVQYDDILKDNTFNIYMNKAYMFAIKLGDDTQLVPNPIQGQPPIPVWQLYFEDASWTISYDPKVDSWISYHDWHPDLVLPGKNTFLSTHNNGIWVHNLAYQSYCNYYGITYPFEVEYMINTVQTVNTLRSIEYQLECYKYDNNAFDRFHVLDYNFDKAVIYNTEQVSGYLRLNIDPRKDPAAIITYPNIGNNVINILFSKVENKYRFNQFWDITDDRGEYNPSAQRMIWNTEANGYARTLNLNNLNYAKDVFQRKKFRHYTNTVWLRKDANSVLYPNGIPYKMLVILTNNKELYSPR